MKSTLQLSMAALFISLAPAAAAESITVAARGSDGPGCGTVASPCRTLQVAMSKVQPGGKVDIVDSADYGPVVINKAVDLVYSGEGVALIQPGAGKVAVAVNAGAADTVRLTGLTLDGAGGASSGVAFIGGGKLEIEKCDIRNFANTGVSVGTGAGNFSVAKTPISDNGKYALVVNRTSGAGLGQIDGVRIVNNGLGGVALFNSGAGAFDIVVKDSLAMSNRGAEAAFRAHGAGARLTLRKSTVMDNTLGASATGGGVVRLTDSLIVENGAAASKASGGVVETFTDNIVEVNYNNALATLTPVPRK